MARTDENVVVRRIRGKFGNMIFRSWGGRSYVSKMPDYRRRKWTKAQKAVRRRFAAAMDYAREVLGNPVMYEYYRKKTRYNQTVWNVAVADYMKRPEVSGINTGDYFGVPGDTIKVEAADNYNIALVLITILSATGFEVESGMAVSNDNHIWIYETKEINRSLKGSRVIVEVRDTPGNIVRKFLDIGT